MHNSCAANALLSTDSMGALIQTFDLVPYTPALNASVIRYSLFTTYYTPNGMTQIGSPIQSPQKAADGFAVGAIKCGAGNEEPSSVELQCSYTTSNV